MTLLITINKNFICYVALIIVIRKFIISKVFKSIVIVSAEMLSETANVNAP